MPCPNFRYSQKWLEKEKFNGKQNLTNLSHMNSNVHFLKPIKCRYFLSTPTLCPALSKHPDCFHWIAIEADKVYTHDSPLRALQDVLYSIY